MSRLVDRITKVLKYCVVIFLAIAVIIITMQVFFRYVLRSPLTWSEQTARYLFIWMMMLGIPLIFHDNSVFRFDVILNKIEKRKRYILMIFSSLVTEFFMVYYFSQSLKLCIKSGHRVVSGLDVPLIVVYIAQPICATLVFIIVLEQLLANIKAAKRYS